MHAGQNLPAYGHYLTSESHSVTVEYILMISSVLIVLISIYLAWFLYRKNKELSGTLRSRFSGLHKLLHGKYFIDELYGAIIVRPLVNGSLFLWKIVDVFIIDGMINGLAVVIGDISTGLRNIQTGKIRTYATVFLAGVILILLFTLLK